MMKTAASLAIVLLAQTARAETPCASTATGNLHVESFASKAYGETQTLRIWVPAEYAEAANAQKKYPVLYLLDGQNLFDECTAFRNEHEWQVDEVLVRLIGSGTIEPLIVVGIDSSAKRNHQYRVYKDVIADAAAPEPIGRQLPSFLADEVLPYVAARYRVAAEAERTGIGGASLAAVAAAFTLVNRPDLFRRGLIQSPTLPLGNGQLLRDTASLARGPDRVYIGVGTTELAIPGGDKFAAQLGLVLDDANAGFVAMAEALARNLTGAYLKRAEVRFVAEPNANHTSTSWARRFPEALTFLYGK
jgi:predicted alpha/beta superfamily hydrolase